MIGIWGSYSSQYIYVVSIGILLGFALPMMIVPMTWARILQWTIPDHEHLAIYFGRCLGGLAGTIAVFAFKVGDSPALLPFYYQLAIAAYCVLALIHVYGAFRKIQPITETIEIAFWVGLILLTLCFYPV